MKNKIRCTVSSHIFKNIQINLSNDLNHTISGEAFVNVASFMILIPFWQVGGNISGFVGQYINNE